MLILPKLLNDLERIEMLNLRKNAKNSLDARIAPYTYSALFILIARYAQIAR